MVLSATSSSSSQSGGGGGGGGVGQQESSSRRKKKMTPVQNSPFFHPSDPRAVRPMSTPGGTIRMQKKTTDDEHKSSIFGASCNLVVSIVGSGIVGIPYSIKQSGLVAGVLMVILCAIITEKSLRLLIETAKHVGVPSYETLFEASFGLKGFYAMSIIMFTMAYGAMISYLMIIKDTLSTLCGVPYTDQVTRAALLAVSTALVLFPISAQRDMADLAKTSRVSVSFYILLVGFVICFSPVQSTVQRNGGWKSTIQNSIIHPSTFFAGLGVLSFAYVCQHSAYIIAGSLDRPTKERWSKVSAGSLFFCGTLATLCGTFGYLGFMDETNGNILNNFVLALDDNNHTENDQHLLLRRLATVARTCLCLCMFCVYPMDAFVSRHVFVVLLFKGRRAHEGDDHAVLARNDRRILLTLAIYLLTLTPALLLNDLGSVLAVTGAIAGSCLSYVCPGSSYLAVHGEEFTRLVKEGWKVHWGNPLLSSSSSCGGNIVTFVLGRAVWYLSLMPLWTRIAQLGETNVAQHYEREALKSPLPPRLGKVHGPKRGGYAATAAIGGAVVGGSHTEVAMLLPAKQQQQYKSKDGFVFPPVRTNSLPTMPDDAAAAEAGKGGSIGAAMPPGTVLTPNRPGSSNRYGAMASPPGAANPNRAIGAALAKQQQQRQQRQQQLSDEEEGETDPQGECPTIRDFVIAIGFVTFGMVAMIVGLWSIFNGATVEG